MSGHFPVACNPGSKNRTVSLAKTILRTKKRGICIQELGANGIGSLDYMVNLFRPTVAVITTIKRDHYSTFRSKAAIAEEKGKLVAALPEHGTAVLNADDPLVARMNRLTHARCFTYGINAEADVGMTDVAAAWPEPLTAAIQYDGQSIPLKTRLYGAHSATAVLAAISAAIAMGVSPRAACAALEQISAPDHRMQAVDDGQGVAFILDDFKAPLDGMPAIFEFAAQARSKRKILIIGTLSDYPGASSPKYRRVTRQALTVADLVLLVGKFANSGLKGQSADTVNRRLFGFRHVMELNEFLQSRLRPGDLVILKGSRKQDHLERLLIARDEKILCWRTECARIEACPDCNDYRRTSNPFEQKQKA